MTSLTARAEAVLALAKKLDSHLEQNNLPYPAFDENDDCLEGLPKELQEQRWSLANASNDLKKLMRGPVMHAIDVAMSWTDSVPLLVIYHYKLAQAVPLDGDVSYAEIAATSGLNESLCRRFMRTAMGSNFFDEDSATHRVRHTAYSRKLVTHKHLLDAIGFQLEDVAPSALKLPAVWNKYGQDVGEQTKTAFTLENNTDESIYNLYAAQPERGRRFGSAMQFYTSDDSWDLHHMPFDWTSPEFDQPGALLIDVGGGHGQISYFLAKNTKNIRFLVQDMPPVIERARTQVPEELKDRVEFTAHNFFEPQPAREDTGPVHFLLRYIVHNWSDAYCVQILNNLRPALKPGSKILIIEFVLDDSPVKNLSERFAFQADMIMATLFNALERRAVDFEQVIKAADSRFELKNIRTAPGSTATSVVEVVWNG